MNMMKLNRALIALILSLFCVGCSNSKSSTPKQSDQSKSEQQVLSKLDRIQKAFDKGDPKTACDLQLKLSKDLIPYENISPQLLKSIGEVQVKCRDRSFLIDFGIDK